MKNERAGENKTATINKYIKCHQQQNIHNEMVLQLLSWFRAYTHFIAIKMNRELKKWEKNRFSVVQIHFCTVWCMLYVLKNVHCIHITHNSLLQHSYRVHTNEPSEQPNNIPNVETQTEHSKTYIAFIQCRTKTWAEMSFNRRMLTVWNVEEPYLNRWCIFTNWSTFWHFE